MSFEQVQKYSNLLSVFREKSIANKDKPYLWSKQNSDYTSISWLQTYKAINNLANYLKSIGIKNDARVLLVSENRPEWQISDIAIMAADGVTVPAYITITSQDYEYIINHSESMVVIVSSQSLFEKVANAINKLKKTIHVIIIDDFDTEASDFIKLHNWADIQKEVNKEAIDLIELESKRKVRTDLSCIIYTSGTSGSPKGVMLSHGSILHNCEGAYKILKPALEHIEDVLFLSWLPLSHSYEHTLQFYNLYSGNQIYYAEGIDKLLQNLAEVKPHLMSAVPRFYENLLQKISSQMSKESKIKQKFFYDTIALGREHYENGKLPVYKSIYNKILSKLVRKKIGNRFGGRLVGLISGGAALNYEVGISLYSLGIPIYQGYGQTESGPVISVNYPGNNKINTVGPLLPNTKVKISDDGEILVIGENVMNGYFRDKNATDAAFDGEWLKTGDIGEFDNDNYLLITDRMKDIIVNSGGDNISPTKIESLLIMEEGISQAMVFGDGEKYLVAIIVTDMDINDNKEKTKAIIDTSIEKVNGILSAIEKIKNYVLIDEEFTIDNEMMTPSMKVRRFKVIEKYKKELDNLYH
ncbi:MAG: long-chain fatty acid--CoA ligase [Rhizobiales bacterium]|nr:long-chain fatty acid--CoA ligase [Hyphomicrobiales bacterium]MBL6770837.1 long-chain fatty acid--CoA ligase [Hyphomicrobiales bacterium]